MGFFVFFLDIVCGSLFFLRVLVVGVGWNGMGFVAKKRVKKG